MKKPKKKPWTLAVASGTGDIRLRARPMSSVEIDEFLKAYARVVKAEADVRKQRKRKPKR